MVDIETYYYYLWAAFRDNHVHGYMIGKRESGKTCLYMGDDGRFVVSYVKKGKDINPKYYDYDEIWDACEDIITRVAKTERQREKLLNDWGSPTNWAERMSEPLIARRVEEASEQESKSTNMVKDVKTILFPSSYFDGKKVDEDLQNEYDAVLATGLWQGDDH